MTEHSKLFAIKLMVKSLRFSDTSLQPIITLIDNLIESEDSRCTEEWAAKLKEINSLINHEL